jgi:hypothetical protein
LFLGILSTLSGSLGAFPGVSFEVSSRRRQAKDLASIAAVSTFVSTVFTFALHGIAAPYQRCEMKTPPSVAELHNKLGAPSSETVESLRLLTAFLKLAPKQRFEVIALVERLATDPAAASDHWS